MEFALCLPILLIALSAATTLSGAYRVREQLQSGLQSGAQLAMLQANSTAVVSGTDIAKTVAAATELHIPAANVTTTFYCIANDYQAANTTSCNLNDLTLAMSCVDSTGTFTDFETAAAYAAAPNTCTGTNMVPGQLAKITATYTYTSPFAFYNWFNLAGTPNKTLSESIIVRLNTD